MNPSPAIAIVHDRLNARGGGEMFLEELAQLYPEAPIYTLLYEPRLFSASPIADHRIHTSFINRLPLATAQHRFYIPLMPIAIERFDLRGYNIIISSSAAFAHGARTHPNQLHISYIHSPMRYAWHQYRQHIELFGLAGLPVRMLLAALRRWDRGAARRATYLVANSAWTATCIREAFGLGSTVIYPPVRVEKFHPAPQRGDYYLTLARLVPYKRVDLIIEVFNRLRKPLIIIGDGPEREKLARKASANISFLSDQSRAEVAGLMGAAKAFVFAAEEDFGIAAVEAQAAGCPVIAYRRGGLLETVIEGKTGIFFDEQSADSLEAAVRLFENGKIFFNENEICTSAKRFSAENFRTTFSEFVTQRWQEFSPRI